MADVQASVDRIMGVYDELTSTRVCGAAEALEITEAVLDELEGRAAGLSADVKAGRGG